MKTLKILTASLLIAMGLVSNAEAVGNSVQVNKQNNESVQVGKILLWNKLGSINEVQRSEVGPNGEIIGDVLFEQGQHGNGFRSEQRTGDPDIPDNFVRFPLPKLNSKGTIQFWYHPDWMDYRVGHVVTLIEYGIPENSNSVVLTFGFNDWQNRGGIIIRDNLNDAVGGYYFPDSEPQWSTTEPIHIAYTWDASANKKFTFYINGQAVDKGYFGYGNPPTFLWNFNEMPYLAVGCRMYSGDWYRHNWEPNIDGIIDNLVVLDYAKTDFSDRFQEAPTEYRPTDKVQCGNSGWMNYYGAFRNQGQCVKYVNDLVGHE